MSTILQMTQKYGFGGLVNYVRLKRGTGRLVIDGLNNPVYLRKIAADVMLFKQIFVRDEYEFSIPGFQPAFIIDAGANIGLSTLFFATKFPDAKIVAIEPETKNVDLLRRNVERYPNITPLTGGLWKCSTKLEIVSYDVAPTGFMVREASPTSSEAIQAFSVPDIMEKFGVQTLDMLKLDVEGAEKEILSENNSWLKNTRVIIIELHDRKRQGCSKAFFSAFADTNFECHPMGQNFLLINRGMF